MIQEVTQKLAKFTLETKYPEIPENVLDFTKGLLLKTTAGMLAGSVHPSSRKMAALVKHRKLAGDVGVLGAGFKTALWEAILLNAFFAHSSELEDDSFYMGGVSWDITVIPLLLPLAQELRMSGKTLIEALAVGLEVHSRTCMFSSDHIGQVVVPGAVGPAAAAARALGLGIKETASAMGIAMSGVGISIPNFGTDAHYLESALQALHGCISAEMAKEKMVGNPDLTGYLSDLIGKENVNPVKIVDGLGETWLFTNIWVKKYPCCFLNHRQIDIVLDLRKKHGLSFENIESIELHTSPADEPCNRPDPRSLGDLQFSFQHIIGSAMLDGDVNFSHVDTDILSAERYREARDKVNVVVHEDRSGVIMEAPAEVIIKTKDGEEFSGKRAYPIGSPEEPLSMEMFRALYSKFCAGVLTSEQIDQTADTILTLENQNDVLGLMDILTFR
jgi:2-methylcitrate dehydratase PrpD